MLRSMLRVARCCLVVLVLPCVAAAQATMGPDDPGGGRKRVALSFGFFLPSYNTDLLVSVGDGTGTGVDLEDDLGFRASDSVIRFDGLFRLADRHHLGFSWLSLDRSSTKAIEEEITWEDVTFAAGAEVNAFFDFDMYDLHYRYTVLRNRKLDVGLGGGLSYMVFDFGASGWARISTDEEEMYFEASRETTVRVPVPAIGADARWELRRNLLLVGNIAYIKGSYDQQKARYSNLTGALLWFPWNNVGFGLMYNWFKVTYEDHSREFTGRFDYRYSGPVLSLSLAF